jgi:choline dehydrogenase-like flavoprotein
VNDIFYSVDRGAHPGGTARIGHIVDENLQTEFENLYVCDTSVIPQPWGLPPVLTCIGLGKRLAKHLAN